MKKSAQPRLRLNEQRGCPLFYSASGAGLNAWGFGLLLSHFFVSLLFLFSDYLQAGIEVPYLLRDGVI